MNICIINVYPFVTKVDNYWCKPSKKAVFAYYDIIGEEGGLERHEGEMESTPVLSQQLTEHFLQII